MNGQDLTKQIKQYLRFDITFKDADKQQKFEEYMMTFWSKAISISWWVPIIQIAYTFYSFFFVSY